MTTRFFFILFLTFFSISFSAQATIVIQSVSGASAFDPNVTPYQVFGGLAGDPTMCNGLSGSEGCNTCIADIFACNTNSVYQQRILTFTILSDTVPDNTVSMPVIRAVGSTTNVTPVNYSTVNGKNSAATLSVRWGDLCSAIESTTPGAGDCFNGATGALNGSATVGFADASGNTLADSIETKVRFFEPTLSGLRDWIDLCDVAVSPMQGICDFTMFPGDTKSYIENLKPFGSFPNSGTLKIKYLRFYYSTLGFLDVHALSSYKDIELDTTSSTSGNVETLSNRVPDLVNNQTYYFRVATVDEAGNITDFTSDDAILDACDPLNTTGGDITLIDASYISECRFMAQPAEVLGLLPKDFNCFIASVSYGSSMEQHVQLFRQFRGDILMKSALGRKLAHLYYKYGPYPAQFIDQHPSLKPFARAALWPAYGVAWVSLNYGIASGICLSLVPLFAGILMFQISRKKSHAKQKIS